MIRAIVFLLLATSCFSFRRREGKGLRAPKDVAIPTITESGKVNQVFGAFSKKMGSLYMMKDAEDVLQMPQGVSVSLQDPEDLVTPLMEKLDKKCGNRFQQTLQGNAKGMHNLDLGSKTLNSDCEKEFQGKLCGTKATIHTSHRDTGTDNKVKARFVMDGESCIPEECVSSKNLAALAEFMRGRAKTIGEEMGNDLEIALAVDCSEHTPGTGVVHAPKKSDAAKSSVFSVGLLAALACLAIGF